LDDGPPRLVTAQLAAELLNQLIGTSDATALLRALAAARLPREGAIYRASLDGARQLSAALGGARWQILDQLPALAKSGTDAGAARTILDELHGAARHDEHEVGLVRPLGQAEQAAIDLIIDKNRESENRRKNAEDEGDAVDDSFFSGLRERQRAGTVIRQVPAQEVPAVVEELCDAADRNQDAVFEIIWRISAPDGTSSDRDGKE
jgi:hypothetical protein